MKQESLEAWLEYRSHIDSNKHLWEGMYYKYIGNIQSCTVSGNFDCMLVYDALKTVLENYSQGNSVFSPFFAHDGIVEQVEKYQNAEAIQAIKKAYDLWDIYRKTFK